MRRRFQIGLGGVAALLAAIVVAGLCTGFHPWEDGLQLKLAAGVELSMRDLGSLWFWWACLGAAIVLVGFASTARWWVGPDDLGGVFGDEEEIESASPGAKKAVWAMVLAAATIATFHAAPRLDHGLWDDEEYTLQYLVHGYWRRDSEHASWPNPYFSVLTAEEMLWHYRTPNNHFLYTLTAKASLAVWRWAGDRAPWEFSETAMRAPPFAAGIAALFAWSFLLWRFGYRWAAGILPLLLALHPWYIHYISEARGYAYMLLFVPLGLLAVRTALATGRWRWWLAYAGLQFLTLYSWPGVAFLAVAFNLGIAGLLLWRCRKRGSACAHFSRWAVANVLPATFVLMMTAPCLPQLADFSEEQLTAPLSWQWRANVHALVATGTVALDFYEGGDVNPRYVSLEHLGSVASWAPAALSALALFGFAFAIWRGDRRRWTLVFAMAAAAVNVLALYVYGRTSHSYIYYCYCLFIVPFYGAGISIALGALGRRLPLALSVAVVGGFLATFYAVGRPKMLLQMRHDTDPQKESVLATRPSLHPEHPENLRILTAQANVDALVYDAHAWYVTEGHSTDPEAPGLTNLMRVSDVEERPLFVNVGYFSDAKTTFPDVCDLLENEELFEVHHTAWGIAPQHTRTIFRYRGGMFDMFK